MIGDEQQPAARRDERDQRDHDADRRRRRGRAASAPRGENHRGRAARRAHPPTANARPVACSANAQTRARDRGIGRHPGRTLQRRLALRQVPRTPELAALDAGRGERVQRRSRRRGACPAPTRACSASAKRSPALGSLTPGTRGRAPADRVARVRDDARHAGHPPPAAGGRARTRPPAPRSSTARRHATSRSRARAAGRRLRNVESRVDSDPSDTMRAPGARCGSSRASSAKCPSTFVASTSSLPSTDSRRAARRVHHAGVGDDAVERRVRRAAGSAPARDRVERRRSITSVSTDAAGRDAADRRRRGIQPLGAAPAEHDVRARAGEPRRREEPEPRVRARDEVRGDPACDGQRERVPAHSPSPAAPLPASSSWCWMTSATTKLNHFSANAGSRWASIGERTQPGDLPLLAVGIARRQAVLRPSADRPAG